MHLVAGAALTHSRMTQGMWNEHNVKLRTIFHITQGIDCQADTINGDRALFSHKGPQIFRNKKFYLPEILPGIDCLDRTHSIHVPERGRFCKRPLKVASSR